MHYLTAAALLFEPTIQGFEGAEGIVKTIRDWKREAPRLNKTQVQEVYRWTPEFIPQSRQDLREQVREKEYDEWAKKWAPWGHGKGVLKALRKAFEGPELIQVFGGSFEQKVRGAGDFWRSFGKGRIPDEELVLFTEEEAQSFRDPEFYENWKVAKKTQAELQEQQERNQVIAKDREARLEALRKKFAQRHSNQLKRRNDLILKLRELPKS